MGSRGIVGFVLPVVAKGDRFRHLAGKRIDGRRHSEILKQPVRALVEIRNRHWLKHQLRDRAATVSANQPVQDEIEFDIDRFAPIRNERCAEAARGDIERHLPAVIEPGREGKTDLADDLQPKLQGQRGVPPFAEWEAGPCLGVGFHPDILGPAGRSGQRRFRNAPAGNISRGVRAAALIGAIQNVNTAFLECGLRAGPAMTILNIDIAPSQVRFSARLTRVVFPATIFLSAGLLFCVEPMFSKMVLPVVGGSAAVWSVAMVVFQGLMLAGYLYAHLLSRFLSLRAAVLMHAIVMAVATLWLPITIASGFSTPPERGLSFWLVGLFLASVGAPCFALAANAPLLQAWFARGGSGNAYLLYRASNLGSFIGLLAYPFLIEPIFGLSMQGRLWGMGFAVLAFGLVASGLLTLRTPTAERHVAVQPVVSRISWNTRLTWLALGFIPSGLLVAVTASIATDIASGPYLWILPLALYLLTFVFAFSDRPVLPAKLILTLQPVSVALLVVLFLFTGHVSWMISLPGQLAAFFVIALVCQTILYGRRPPESSLTQFYVWMSLGGVLGGSFAALAAPYLFSTILEYPLLVFAALLVRPEVWRSNWRDWLREILIVGVLVGAVLLIVAMMSSRQPALYGVMVMVLAGLMAFQVAAPARLLPMALGLLLVTNLHDPSQTIVKRARSFYGAYKIVDLPPGKFRVLFQGTVAHGGEQVRDDKGVRLTARPNPLTYYYEGGPFSIAIAGARALAGGTLHRVAVVGLGMGALSCQSRPDESWSFYELDPLNTQIAFDRSLFRSIALCTPGAPVITGDGRLTLHQAKPGLDLLALDAFSSDSVPIHLLTREAFALYKSRLGPHGVIAINISNRNVELEDVIANSAAASGMVTSVALDTRKNDKAKTLRLNAKIALVTRNRADMAALKLGTDWRLKAPEASVPVWTDDYSNILGAVIRKMREP